MFKRKQKKWFGFGLAGALARTGLAISLCLTLLPKFSHAAGNSDDNETTIAYWQFNQGTGEQVAATNNPGLVLKFTKGEQAALPEWVETKEGKGIRFSGNKGACLVGDGEAFKTDIPLEPPFSIEYWLTLEEPLPGYNGGLFQCMEYLQKGFRCGINKEGLVLFEVHGKGAAARVFSTKALDLNRSCHIMFLVESDQISFYINDRLDTIRKFKQPYIPCQAAAIRIGHNSGAYNDFSFNGIIRAIRIKRYKTLWGL